MHAGDDQCKHGADAEDTVQVVCLWSLYLFLLFQPLHNHEQHQRAAKGRQRRDFKPAQGWNETISMKLDEKDDDYCCEYSQRVQ